MSPSVERLVMKITVFVGILIFVCSVFVSGEVMHNTANWAVQESFSRVDLTGEDGKSIGYAVSGPVSSTGDIGSQSPDKIRWTMDMKNAGVYILTYVPSPVIGREDEFFEIYERDISFFGETFPDQNLDYDGAVYSCWGRVGENTVRYDCARFIDGNFFIISSVFESMDEALRYNLKLREIILTIGHSGT